MNNIVNKKELIGIIEQALYNNELAVFAGAGLSIDAGYYSWEKLLEEPAKKLELDISKEKHDLISLAQFYCNKNKRSAINELLLDSFPSNKKPTENHKILSQLPISTYWTTNFDTLIEDALKENNKNVSVRKADKDLQLSYKNYDAVVYKMHGDIQSPSEAVITRDDYEEYGINSRKLFRDVLEGALLTKTFLFLGFSFSDPNFNFVLSKMRVLLGDDNRSHYYILKKLLNLIRISLKKKKNIKKH
ncbi:SIR2-like domain protein [Atopobium sp. ICM42b]|uniref:SIR2 family protein n=1 Tax=Atopobium sp. ICM42b TaxID=1190620 RepID=UPI00044DCF47|nr:SIR2 family protein [Atopobium sp. ICM42b]EWC94460.1 SIR2-like domain protein [Atopobium sp. ICM42b]